VVQVIGVITHSRAGGQRGGGGGEDMQCVGAVWVILYERLLKAECG
jgi:hypothetical protein